MCIFSTVIGTVSVVILTTFLVVVIVLLYQRGLTFTVIMSSKYQTYRTTLNVLLITPARVIGIKLAIVATLRLEMLFAIVAVLNLVAMGELCVIG